MKDNSTSKKQGLSEQEEAERQELLAGSKVKTGRQLEINLSTGTLEEIDEIRALLGSRIDDPTEKYNLYYKGIDKLLRTHLPKGKEFEVERRLIYDEKNVFLNLGKKKSDNNGIRGSDGRMTYQPVMNELLDVVIKWVSESQNPTDLYHALYILNDQHGYGHEDYDASSRKVRIALERMNRAVEA